MFVTEQNCFLANTVRLRNFKSEIQKSRSNVPTLRQSRQLGMTQAATLCVSQESGRGCRGPVGTRGTRWLYPNSRRIGHVFYRMHRRLKVLEVCNPVCMLRYIRRCERSRLGPTIVCHRDSGPWRGNPTHSKIYFWMRCRSRNASGYFPI